MKWRPIITVGLICAAVAGVVLWVIHARVFGHWLQVHTGTVDETGPYYGFWSGFGSDLTEFGIIGAVATAAYQLFKKYNCHHPGCWRVGNHPAAAVSSRCVTATTPTTRAGSQRLSSSSGCTASTWSAKRRRSAGSMTLISIWPTSRPLPTAAPAQALLLRRRPGAVTRRPAPGRWMEPTIQHET